MSEKYEYAVCQDAKRLGFIESACMSPSLTCNVLASAAVVYNSYEPIQLC